MSHNPEQLAAAYLAGLRPGARATYEAHLLSCEPCWTEVTLARRGRELAEAAREVAPTELRENIRAAVNAAAAETASRPPERGNNRIRLTAAAFVAVAAITGTVAVTHPWRHPIRQTLSGGDQSGLAAAVASYRHGQLPGTAVPSTTAPDLSAAGLRLIGAATGQVNGIAVTTFAYRDNHGTRLSVYTSTQPFAETAEAHELGGREGAWTVLSNGVTVLCARGSHTTLLLGSNPELVQRAATLLDAI